MNHSNSWLTIIATFLIAFILTILPMPSWTIWLRPAWILMVLIYWVMFTPHAVNVGVAWMIGILLDVSMGTLLGEHALAMTIVAFIVSKTNSQLRMFPLVQQGVSVFVLVLIYQFILYCIQGFIGQVPNNWLYWSSSVTSMLLWPWVFSIIRDYRHRTKVA